MEELEVVETVYKGSKEDIEDEATNRNICNEYRSLLDRSQELFTILRDMPRFALRHWQTHFMKTFDVFTKLWKFQQENRKLLQKEVQLKRHEIGEIASKIGQLYYHYYLYTSDLKYLHEAHDFYEAILTRGYFKTLGVSAGVELKVKSLRYLARYFVVALLLKKYKTMATIQQSIQAELDSLPSDAEEEKKGWALVSKEGFNFMDLDTDVTVLNEANEIVYIPYRLTSNELPLDETKKLKLQNAIVIGGCERQIKFSELTIDMFRMLQLIEYLPEKSKSPTSGVGLSFVSSNPLKHLLYKPSFGQINAFLSAVYKDLAENSILLLYISGDEEKTTSDSKKPLFTIKNIEKHKKEKFYPEDIAPFTRVPMFLIVDTYNSQSYQSLPSLFQQPRICLMSPAKLPTRVTGKQHGSIFTLFLLEPILGICRLCNIHKLQEKTWDACKALFNKVGQLAMEMLLEEKIDLIDSFGQLLHDPFLQNIMLHFLICLFVFRLFQDSQGVMFLPVCSPSVPNHILNHKVLHRYVLDVLELMEVREMFFEHSQLPQL